MQTPLKLLLSAASCVILMASSCSPTGLRQVALLRQHFVPSQIRPKFSRTRRKHIWGEAPHPRGHLVSERSLAASSRQCGAHGD